MNRWTTRAVCLAVLLGAVSMPDARAKTAPAPDPSVSPAQCGTNDTPETGIQGEVPLEDQESGRTAQGYSCGLSVVAELPGGGAVQAYDHCAYVRTSGGRPGQAGPIKVVDLTDPADPKEIRTLPVFTPVHGSSSETMRAIVTDERALLVSGSGVYDIEDCDDPVVLGQIQWPGVVPWPAGLSHDIRISHDGTQVVAGLGVVVADLTDLDDPSTWTVQDHSCDIAAQFDEKHMAAAALGQDLCDHGWEFGDTLSHGPDVNGPGTRLYVGTQTSDSGPTLRVVDMTVSPPEILDEIEGPGHSVDWFRSVDGREFVLHANELNTGDTCQAHPRSSALGWAYEAFITEVTGDALSRASMVELAINKPEHCEAREASGQDASIAYHAVDDPSEAKMAMVSFGDAGLRVFDIRDPESPQEVAYFNVGPLVHAGVSHYDAARGLMLVPGGSGLQVLELQPQVIKELRLPKPTDPAYPRYPDGRPARPEPSAAGGMSFAPAQFGTLDVARYCRIAIGS